jgi:hypothetical protein
MSVGYKLNDNDKTSYGVWLTSDDASKDYHVHVNDKHVEIGCTSKLDWDAVAGAAPALIFSPDEGLKVQYVDKQGGVHLKEIGPKKVFQLLAQLLDDAVDTVS